MKSHSQGKKKNSLTRNELWINSFPLPVFFILLLLPFLILPIEARADFCWSLNGEVCDVTSPPDPNRSVSIKFENGTVVKIDRDEVVNDLTFKSQIFKFRSSGGNIWQRWKLTFDSFNHYYTDLGSNVKEPSSSPYQLKRSLSLESNSISLDSWSVGDVIEAKGNILNGFGLLGNGMSGDMFLQIVIPGNDIKNLELGFHTYEFKIKGSDIQWPDYIDRMLTYTLEFEITETKQVEISGLDPVNLKKFPDFLRSHEQTLCVYANVDNTFSIEASGTNTASNYFALRSDGNEIKYKPFFAMLAHDGGMFEIEKNKKHTKDALDNSLMGSATKGCNGDNMKLQIDVDESFQFLSTIPAGVYTDTLTLEVSAE